MYQLVLGAVKECATTMYTWVPSKYKQFSFHTCIRKVHNLLVVSLWRSKKHVIVHAHVNYWLHVVQHTVWRAHPPMRGVTTSKNVTFLRMCTLVTCSFAAFGASCAHMLLVLFIEHWLMLVCCCSE